MSQPWMIGWRVETLSRFDRESLLPAVAIEAPWIVSPERYEIGHLPGLDAISLTSFSRPNARYLAGADQMQDGGQLRRELERVAKSRCELSD